MTKITMYSASSGYHGCASVIFRFFSKALRDDFVKDRNEDDEFYVNNIEEHVQTQPFFIDHSSQFTSLDKTGTVQLTPVLRDVHCSKDYAYTLPEFKEEAEQIIKKMNDAKVKHSDAYYDQPWV
jgi:hypothetical protein